MTSGALVVAVTREGQHLDDTALWSDHVARLQAAYDQFVVPGVDGADDTMSTDLMVVLMHLSIGGEEGINPDFSPHFPGARYLYGTATAGTWPDFVVRKMVSEFRDGERTIASVGADDLFHDGEEQPPLRGWVPTSDAYTDLVDDYITEFGHPPGMFFISADTGVVNELEFRIHSGVTNGITALGVAGLYNEQVKRPPPNNNIAGTNHQSIYLGNLIYAIQKMRLDHGVTCEQTEFSYTGYVVDEQASPHPRAVEVRDTIFGAMERMLNRVRGLNL